MVWKKTDVGGLKIILKELLGRIKGYQEGSHSDFKIERVHHSVKYSISFIPYTTHARTQTHTRINTHIHTQTHAHINTHTHIHTHKHTNTHTHNLGLLIF